MAGDSAERSETLGPDALIAARFLALAVLGQGGMGAVYRVLDRRTGRRVALKQLRTGSEDSAARR